ncbi:hypothetical protein ACU8KH_02524 [Lachancea thermotolerans]
MEFSPLLLIFGKCCTTVHILVAISLAARLPFFVVACFNNEISKETNQIFILGAYGGKYTPKTVNALLKLMNSQAILETVGGTYV